MLLTSGLVTVNGAVNNTASGSIEVANSPAVFTGNVTNTGFFKTTNTTVEFGGTFFNLGAYLSDPSTQYLNDMIIGSTGVLTTIEPGDTWLISNNFVNTSNENVAWNTGTATLGFETGADMLHDYYMAGWDYGANISGYTDNFAWGTLDIATNNTLNLYDGDTVNVNVVGGEVVGVDYSVNLFNSGAAYVGEMLGVNFTGLLVNNIYGTQGLNIYYMASLDANAYLGGNTYDFTGGASS